jgi:endonuclease III
LSRVVTTRALPIRRIAESLAAEYGTPTREPLPLGNQADPLDELVYILLTVMTEFGVDDVWRELKRRYPEWDSLLRARHSTIARLLQPIGLSEQRATRLQTILRRIRADRGVCTLDFLAQMPDAEAEAYLTSLPGVGTKVARCILMYSLGRDVLPVDAHVLRVAKRLRLLDDGISWSRAHDAIHEVVAPAYRYALHVNLVRHGRAICRARDPRCTECGLLGNLCAGIEPAIPGRAAAGRTRSSPPR